MINIEKLKIMKKKHEVVKDLGEEVKFVKINDKEVLEELDRKIEFKYDCGYNRNKYYKYYKNGNLDEKLGSNPSLALGASEINMLDYASAYATLASGGERNDAYFRNRVEDINGNVVYIHKDNGKQVLDESITYILNESFRF